MTNRESGNIVKETVPRRGRPRSTVAHASVATWLPADVHDKLIIAANQREMSVSALVRRVLVLTLKAR